MPPGGVRCGADRLGGVFADRDRARVAVRSQAETGRAQASVSAASGGSSGAW